MSRCRRRHIFPHVMWCNLLPFPTTSFIYYTGSLYIVTTHCTAPSSPLPNMQRPQHQYYIQWWWRERRPDTTVIGGGRPQKPSPQFQAATAPICLMDALPQAWVIYKPPSCLNCHLAEAEPELCNTDIPIRTRSRDRTEAQPARH